MKWWVHLQKVSKREKLLEKMGKKGKVMEEDV